MRVFVGAAGSLILTVDQGIAASFNGHAIIASAAVRDGSLALVFRSGGDGRGPHLRPIGGGEYQTDFQFNQIKGWGRRCPKFRKQPASSAEMSEGVLVVGVDIERVRPPIQRPRRGAGENTQAPVVSTRAEVDAGELQRAVQTVNQTRRQMGSLLALEIDDEGLLHAKVDFH